MGAAWGLTIGVIVALLLRDRRKMPPQLTAPVNINLGLGHLLPHGTPEPAQVTQVATQQTASSTRPTRLDTYSLSSDPTSPSRVATAASERHWLVRVHNVGPPGSFAVVDTSFVGMSFPTSQGITIPAGGDHPIRLRPREALFAIGSVPGVILSVSSSEEIA